MRSSILNLLPTVNLGGFSVSQELPFSPSGVELYIRNPRVLYVDREVTESAPLFATLDAHDISTTISSATVYFTTDAKNSPLQLDALITSLRSIKNRIDFPGANRREIAVRTSYTGDLLINEVEYRFTRVA